MPLNERFGKAIILFDAYNSNDPHLEKTDEGSVPKELLYARRMTEKLEHFAPEAPEYLRLAAHCQHIGRWEIPRESYPKDRKGYLQWRNTLKDHHAKIAQQILKDCEYEMEIIDKVKFLLLKKELHKNADTQTLEDVICLVFVQYYLDEFALKHENEKVTEILQKTMKKMSSRAIDEAGRIPVSEKVKSIMQQAASG